MLHPGHEVVEWVGHAEMVRPFRGAIPGLAHAIILGGLAPVAFGFRLGDLYGDVELDLVVVCAAIIWREDYRLGRDAVT